MTYDQLKVLDAIITEGSFNAASRHLFISQPSISIAIKKLEGEFNLKLFSRDQYRPVLTPAGKAFYQKSKRVLEQTKSLELLGKQLSMGNEPEIRIAIDAVFPLPLISGLLKHYENEHPATKLYLGSEYLNGAVERVLDGTADIALIPKLQEDPKLESIHLSHIQMIPTAAPAFCPVHATYELSLDEMKDYVQVIVEDSSHQETNRLSHGVLEGGRIWLVNDFLTKKQMLLEGLGWGRLPLHMIEGELKSGHLLTLKIQNIKSVKVEIQAVRKLDGQIGPIATKIWNDLKLLPKK